MAREVPGLAPLSGRLRACSALRSFQSGIEDTASERTPMQWHARFDLSSRKPSRVGHFRRNGSFEHDRTRGLAMGCFRSQQGMRHEFRRDRLHGGRPAVILKRDLPLASADHSNITEIPALIGH